VFVLSLLGMPEGLTLDRQHMHVATSRCVIVLQTTSAPIALPYMADGAHVFVNPRTPTRHVVAGLATALGGVGAPFQRFLADKRTTVSNYLWAHGAVPWGPFSNSSSLSLLFGDLAVRNGVCARVSAGMRAIARAMQTMRRFHRDFIDATDLTPLQLSRDVLAPVGTPDNRGALGLKQQGVAVLARDVSVRLAQELNGIEQQFLQLSDQIKRQQWTEATRLSGAILLTSRAFDKYVTSELDAARRSLECCHKVYAESADSVAWIVVLVLAVIVATSSAGYAFVRQRAVTRAPSRFRSEDSHMLRSLLGGLAGKQQRGHML